MITAERPRIVAAAGEPLAECSRRLALEGFTPHFATRATQFRDDPVWVALRDLGTALWLDTGDLEEARSLWTRQFSNLTTNNTLVNKEVQKGAYDAFVPTAARALREAQPGIDEATLVSELGFILNCHVALRLVEAFDATVSVELHAALGDDVEASVAYGRRFFAVCPQRFIVKVPMTAAGFLAARQLANEGVPINYTLGFSARQNYLAARFSHPQFVNVFMGRLNAFVIDNKLGDGEHVGEKATLASQRALLKLRAQNPDGSRQIGASMRAAEQLYDLAGLDVFTMPTAVAREFHRQMAEEPRELTSQVERDFEVHLKPGVDRRALGIDQLWEIPQEVVAFADALERMEVTGWSGEQFADAGRRHGVGYLFPRLSSADLDQIEADGKIPVYQRWAERLAGGDLGLDALMSISALYSFVKDQRAVDDRIRAHIAG